MPFKNISTLRNIFDGCRKFADRAAPLFGLCVQALIEWALLGLFSVFGNSLLLLMFDSFALD